MTAHFPKTSATFLFSALALCCAACGGCPPGGGSDGGTQQSSSTSSGGSDGGRRDGGADGGRRDGGDAGPSCGQDTPGFGEDCGQCGHQVCGRTGTLICADPGFNACGVCGTLELTGGIVGRTCGTCGMVGCADGGLVTECQGEHPPNACGGCGSFPLLGGIFVPDGGAVPDGSVKGPPDGGCSSCATGVWTCQASLNDLSCVGGRAANNACGGCGTRCIQYYADMGDLSEGAFIRAGTRAIIEDVGTDSAMRTSATAGTKVLSFDPLLTGPAGLVLEAAVVYLSPNESHTDPRAFALAELFSAYTFGEPGDPVRQYLIYPNLDAALASMHFVIVYDGFVQRVVSRGPLTAGAPP